MNLTFRIIIEPDSKGYHAFSPVLKGCHSWGKTIEHARKNIREAIELYLESMQAHGENIPSDTGIEMFESFLISPTSLRKQKHRTSVYA